MADIACFRLETVLRLFWGRGTRHEIHQVQALRAFMFRLQPLPHRRWATRVCRKALLAQFDWLEWYVASPVLRQGVCLPWAEKNRRFRPSTWRLYIATLGQTLVVRSFTEAELALMKLRLSGKPLAEEETRGSLIALSDRRAAKR